MASQEPAQRTRLPARIRLVKVAGSVLALFVITGAFLYGFDLKKASEEIKGARERTLTDIKELSVLKTDVIQLQRDISRVAAEAKIAVAEITQRKEEARGIVASMRPRGSRIGESASGQGRRRHCPQELPSRRPLAWFRLGATICWTCLAFRAWWTSLLVGSTVVIRGDARMDTQQIVEAFRMLPADERVRLVEELWDEVAREIEQRPLSEAQRRLLDERIRQHEEMPTDVEPWETARDDLLRDL